MMNKIDDDLCSTSDSESDEFDFSAELIKIEDFRTKIKQNFEDYDSHCNLIKSLRVCEDENGVRLARESMNEHFPLSPEMWLEWIEDEKKINTDKSIIYKLLRQSVEDYRSVEIWAEFCQFSLGYFEDSFEIRKIFEEAVSQIGTNYKGGNIIWTIWRIYETGLLMECLDSDKNIEQREKVFKLYSRELSLALSGNKEVFEEFIEWNKEFNYSTEDIKERFNRSCKIMESLKQFEDNLDNADVDYVSQKENSDSISKEERWMEYLIFAEECISKKEDHRKRIFQNKADIINLYERAITDICLSQSLWGRYLRYLSKNFENDQDRILIACKRAVRNNKSSLDLRLLLVRNMERFSCLIEDIRKAFAEILRSSMSDKNPFLPVWQSYLDFEKRQISISKDLTVIRGLFENLVSISNYLDYDPSCMLIKYWAFVEARYGKNLDKARELWTIVRKSLGTSNSALWVENLEFEKRFGDFESCKVLMSNAVNCFTDYPEYLFEKVLRCVAEEGDIESYLKFMKKIEEQQVKINKRKLKEEETKKQEIPDRKLKRPNDEKKNKISQAKKPRVAESVKESFSPSKNTIVNDKVNIVEKCEERCVFVSNLNYKVTEKELEEIFSSSGDLEEIRLGKMENGRSKGFAFIQFKDKSAVEEALKLEHTILMERPMFVNRSDPNKRHSFKYTVGEAEKNKLFIKNLPKTTTKHALEEIYSKYGSLTDVRLITLRNGMSKGIAYVEFLDENTASKALVDTDGMMIGDKTIEVAISKTPQKNVGSVEDATPKTETFLVPRSLHKAPSTQKMQIHQSSVGSSNSDVSSVKKSNSDFRKFL